MLSVPDGAVMALAVMDVEPVIAPVSDTRTALSLRVSPVSSANRGTAFNVLVVGPTMPPPDLDATSD